MHKNKSKNEIFFDGFVKNSSRKYLFSVIGEFVV